MIKRLSRNGIEVIPEVSRAIIISEQQKESDGTPWENVGRFNQLVFEETVKQLALFPQAIFSDRGLIDNIAYLKCAGLKIPPELNLFPFTEEYQSTVFFAPPWKNIYVKDEQRPQSFKEHVPLNKVLIEAYANRGFKLIFLPFDTVEKRIEFILDRIKLA